MRACPCRSCRYGRLRAEDCGPRERKGGWFHRREIEYATALAKLRKQKQAVAAAQEPEAAAVDEAGAAASEDDEDEVEEREEEGSESDGLVDEDGLPFNSKRQKHAAAPSSPDWSLSVERVLTRSRCRRRLRMQPRRSSQPGRLPCMCILPVVI